MSDDPHPWKPKDSHDLTHMVETRNLSLLGISLFAIAVVISLAAAGIGVLVWLASAVFAAFTG